MVWPATTNSSVSRATMAKHCGARPVLPFLKAVLLEVSDLPPLDRSRLPNVPRELALNLPPAVRAGRAALEGVDRAEVAVAWAAEWVVAATVVSSMPGAYFSRSRRVHN